ncbi:putative fructose-bisphosphate aldolase [Colletotrichum trifolii]|uniref:Fructose-bisphosphate aldolase n=1 Tax=Colletotrichum trifolii TaxID=5466 RepID=A0A4R8QQY8_COLTR|nr:putative fructose-bisphosphate aldolase [Colletotrichum trifolii]
MSRVFRIVRPESNHDAWSRAEEGQYGVVAPIAYNIENIISFIRAAKAKRSPLIIQVFPWAITFSSLTTVEQVEGFIATGIDFLAPAFGKVHGQYGTRGPVLEFDR